jgi:hypothetical protein
VERLPELGVLAHGVAVTANRDEMAVVHKPIDQRRRHHLVAEDLAPFLKALV